MRATFALAALVCAVLAAGAARGVMSATSGFAYFENFDEATGG